MERAVGCVSAFTQYVSRYAPFCFMLHEDVDGCLSKHDLVAWVWLSCQVLASLSKRRLGPRYTYRVAPRQSPWARVPLIDGVLSHGHESAGSVMCCRSRVNGTNSRSRLLAGLRTEKHW